jgi:hypothetical protein
MRIGILFSLSDLDYMIKEDADVVVITPGSDIDESEVLNRIGIKCVHLNDFLEEREASSLSSSSAEFIRFIMDLGDYPIEAHSSQGDLYQYHLRMQFLFLVSLERYLMPLTSFVLLFSKKGYANYCSPMRPEQGMLYDQDRTMIFLASQLARNLGGRCESVFPSLIERTSDFLLLALRRKMTSLFIFFKLLHKVLVSKRYLPSENLVSGFLVDGPKVGIIVRTDSEVVSANALIEGLDSANLEYVVIQDEILSSTTTTSRLRELTIPFVPLGALGGFSTLFAALKDCLFIGNAPKKKVAYKSLFTQAENTIFSDFAVVLELQRRLFDFFLPQRHFFYELENIAKYYNVNCLITFAYIDQWGGMVKAVGDSLGIKTIAVQNAAQDPEEFPRLCWADHYCVESLYFKRRLISLGYPESMISGTGLPHFTDVLTNGDVQPNLRRNRQILILTQPIYEKYYNQLIIASAKFCRKNNYTLTIKYHPRQTGKEYKKAINFARQKCIVDVFKTESLDTIILSSRLVISVVSAAILRSLNLGVPTVSFLPKSEKYLDLYYTEAENLFVVSSIDALNELLERVNEDYQAILKEFEGKIEHYKSNHLRFELEQDPRTNITAVVLSKLTNL